MLDEAPWDGAGVSVITHFSHAFLVVSSRSETCLMGTNKRSHIFSLNHTRISTSKELGGERGVPTTYRAFTRHGTCTCAFLIYTPMVSLVNKNRTEEASYSHG